MPSVAASGSTHANRLEAATQLGALTKSERQQPDVQQSYDGWRTVETSVTAAPWRELVLPTQSRLTSAATANVRPPASMHDVTIADLWE